MKILQLLSLLILFVISPFSLLAQMNDDGAMPADNYMPLSPEAATLIKFIDIPISYYTGIPQINVPITSIEERELTLPVSLSFHAGGHKVGEMASWVGLGWKLNAGGTITRKVRGLPDDSDVGQGFLEFRQNYSYQDVFNGYNQENIALCEQLAMNCWDSEPDEFYFSFQGYEGKFAFDWTGNDPVVSSEAKVRVESTISNGSIDKFIITAPDGVIYHFEEKEITETTSVSGQVPNPFNFANPCTSGTQSHTSSWHLSKIESPNFSNRFILLYYSDYTINYDWTYHESRNFYSPYNDSDCPGDLAGQSPQISSSNVVIYGKQLNQVTTSSNNYRLDFNGLNLRSDNNGINSAQNFYQLDEIVLYGPSPNQKIITKHVFNYFYQGRLMLGSVTQIGRDGGTLPPYEFTYNSTSLPNLQSKAVDHWGFYNGKNNSTLVPDYSDITFYPDGTFFAVNFDGGDREPDEEYAKASILTEMKQPTGGITRLQYESNEYSYISTASVEDQENYDVVETPVPPCSATGNLSNPGQFVIDEQLFTVTQDPTMVRISYTGHTYANFGGSALLPNITIEDLNGNPVGLSSPIVIGPPPSGYSNYPYNDSGLREVSLPPGTYKVICKAMAFSGAAGADKVTATLTLITIDELSPIIAKKAGGVRVKRMEVEDPVNGSNYTRTFDYHMLDESGYSSGVIYAEPIYTYHGTIVQSSSGSGGTIPVAITCDYIEQIGSSKIILGATSGSHIGYRTVTEYIGEGGGNGKIEYEFTSPFDNGDLINFEKPFGHPVSNSFKTGLLTESRVYDNDGSLKRETINSYSYKTQEVNSPKIGIGTITPGEFAGTFPFQERFAAWLQPLRMGISRLTSSTQTDYFASGNVIKISSNEYDTDLQLLKKEAVVNSDGVEFATVYKYVEDEGGAAGGCMIEKNMVGIPIKVEQQIGGATYEGTWTDFGSYFGGAGCTGVAILPYEIYSFEDGWEKKTTIEAYYTDGLPQRIKHKGWAPIEYVWSDGLLTTKDFLQWHWEFDYDPDIRLLNYQQEIDGQDINYDYDEFNRLNEVREREDNITTSYTYTYGGPNTIETETTYSDAPTQTIVTSFDGLGRHIQTEHNDVIKEEYKFDDFNRLSQETYLPGNLMDHLYDGSPLNRLEQTVYPDESSITLEYDAESNYYLQTTNDEKENPTTVLTDIVGRQSEVRNAIGGVTQFIYDNRGNLEQVNPPSGDPYQYTFDSQNRLSTKSIPGAGTQQFFYYEENDLLKYTVDAKQNRVDYTYDAYGREWQVFHGTSAVSQGSLVLENQYGESDGGINIGKLKLKRAKMLSTGGGFTETEFFYDPFGRVNLNQERYFLDGGSNQDDFGYDYNHADWLLKETRNHSGYIGLNVTTTHIYDNFGREINRIMGANYPNAFAIAMEYNDRDEMTVKKLGSLGGDSYLEKQVFEYTERGWLESINTITHDEDDWVTCGPEPEYEEEEPVLVEQSVSLTELIELICKDEEFTVDELDPCVQGDCYEEFNTYSIGMGFPCIFGLIGVNEGLIPLANYPYCFNQVSPISDLLISDLENWFSTTDYQYDSITVENTGRGHITLVLYNTNFRLDRIEIECGHTEFIVLPGGPFENISAIYLDGNYVDLPNYPYCDIDLNATNSIGEIQLLADFNNWAQNNNVLFNELPQSSVIFYASAVTPHQIRFLTIADEVTIEFQDCCSGIGCKTIAVNSSQYNQYGCKPFIKKKLEALLPCTPNVIDQDEAGIHIDKGPTISTLYQVETSAGTTVWMLKEDLSSLSGDYALKTRLHITSPQMKVKARLGTQEMELTVQQFISAANQDSKYELLGKSDSEPTEEECTFTPLGCTPSQEESQIESLQDIRRAMCKLDINNLTFPVTLYLVRLCDGSTTYILGDDMLNDLDGPHVILDQLPITSPDDGIGINILVILEKPLFSMDFNHEPNGNIQKARWKVTNRSPKFYEYSYDPLNRLTNAEYGEEALFEVTPGNFILQTIYSNYYKSFNLGYDAVGNILNVSRYGMIPDGNCFIPGIIDELTLSYNSSTNQLLSVVDGAAPPFQQYGFKPNLAVSTDYKYDANGNLIGDPHKQLNMEYNFLNLPKQIGSLEIAYDASGRKWSKQGGTIKQDYVLGIEYKDRQLDAIYDTDGRLVPEYDEYGASITGMRVEYWIKDHLGNVRLSFSDLNMDGSISVQDNPATSEEDVEILQENHYYPFGMNQMGPWYEIVAPENKYQYNGKELNTDLGLNWNDYGARWYDASIGRWNAVDPLAEKYYSYSSYHYALNNPIRFIDPDGMSVDDIILRLDPNGSCQTCLEEFVEIINSNFNGQFQARTEQVYDSDGNVIEGQERLRIVSTGGDMSRLSEGAQNFVKGLIEVTENGMINTEITLVSGDNTVHTGNYDQSAIDVADIKQFPTLDQSTNEQPGPTQAGKILHEVREQVIKQFSTGLAPGQQGSFGQKASDHTAAIKFEDGVNGNTRIGDKFARGGVEQRFQLSSGQVNRYMVGITGKVISVNKLK